MLVLTGPIPATDKVLHEAVAPVPLAWLAETGADEARLNPLGGGTANATLVELIA